MKTVNIELTDSNEILLNAMNSINISTGSLFKVALHAAYGKLLLQAENGEAEGLNFFKAIADTKSKVVNTYCKVLQVSKRIIMLSLLLLFAGILQAENLPKTFNNTGSHTELYNKIVVLVANDLQINTDSITIYISVADFNTKITTEFAVVTDVLLNSYSICIQQDLFKEDRIRAIIHELVHVSQLYNKRLVIRKTYNWFEGQVVTSKVEFANRKYEIEACEKTDKLYQKYGKELKSK
jgi:hypothetical protein